MPRHTRLKSFCFVRTEPLDLGCPSLGTSGILRPAALKQTRSSKRVGMTGRQILLVIKMFATMSLALAAFSACGQKQTPAAKPSAPKGENSAQPKASAIDKADTQAGTNPTTPAQDVELSGTLTPDQRWPPQVGVDILVVAEAPGLAATEVDALTRPTLKLWRAAAGVSQVFSRASAAEFRAVVRFDPGAKPSAARALVADLWQKLPNDKLGPLRLEAIARGARAQQVLMIVAAGGRAQATVAAQGPLQQWAAQLPKATRAHIVGAVRPYLVADLISPSIRNSELDFAQILDALPKALGKSRVAPTDAAADEGLRTELASMKLPRHQTAGAQTLPPVGLDQVLAVTRAVGEPTREARNGQVPMTALLADGGFAPADAGMGAADTAWRRKPYNIKLLGSGVELFPVALSHAYRFALWLRPGQKMETLAELSARLQKTRLGPEMTGMFAMQGQDGIPESIDVEGQAGRVWTVWVVLSTPDMEMALRAALDRLGDGAWKAHLLTDSFDSALGWLTESAGTAGMFVTSPTGENLAANVSQVAAAINKIAKNAQLQTGPPRHPAADLFARLQQPNVARVPAAALAIATHLSQSRVYLGQFGTTPVWLGSGGAALQSEIGKLPLAYQDYDAKPAATSRVWLLSDLLQLPVGDLVLDRLRVDDRPALWLTSDSMGDLPAVHANGFWDLVERTLDLHDGIAIFPFDLSQRALGVAAP